MGLDEYKRWVCMSIRDGYGLVSEMGMDEYRRMVWMS